MNRQKINRQTMQIQFGTKTIPFEVNYRKRKTMEIRVEPPDRVTVVAPQGMPQEVILQKVYGRGGLDRPETFSMPANRVPSHPAGICQRRIFSVLGPELFHAIGFGCQP